MINYDHHLRHLNLQPTDEAAGLNGGKDKDLGKREGEERENPCRDWRGPHFKADSGCGDREERCRRGSIKRPAFRVGSGDGSGSS